MKTIDTLIRDIYGVIEGKGGWDNTITEYLSHSISSLAEERFSKEQKPRDYLSLSSVGTPCKRKIWYRINQPESGEPIPPKALGNFFYGDLLEALVLALAKAAGHKVEGEQEQLEINGVFGHRDAIIDGVTVDVKSASNFGFSKFQNHKLREDDPFGYISQLSSYVYAGKDDPRVKDKKHGAFLAIKKEKFDLCLDTYDFSEEIKAKEEEIESAKTLVQGGIPEERLAPVPQKPDPNNRQHQNKKLCIACSLCEYRKVCWPEARTFLYGDGPVHLVHVEHEPRVTELIE